MALAFDQMRMIPSLPYKLDKITEISFFVRMVTRDAIDKNVLHASAIHYPYISSARGVQCHPRSKYTSSARGVLCHPRSPQLEGCNATLDQSTSPQLEGCYATLDLLS